MNKTNYCRTCIYAVFNEKNHLYCRLYASELRSEKACPDYEER